MIRDFSAVLSSAVITFALQTSLLSKTADLRFQDLTIAEGLSNNTVRCIMQDSRGFMWFGTPNGLNKYDGYGFTVYRNEPGEPRLISCSDILSLFEDSSGDIWVGTKSCSVYIYDRAKDQVNRFLLDSDSTGVFNDQGVFERYGYDKAKKNTISSNRVFSLTGDGRGHLFLGTVNGGLSVLDLETGEFSNYTFKLG